MVSEVAMKAALQIGKLLGLFSTDQHSPGVTHGDVAGIIDEAITEYSAKLERKAAQLDAAHATLADIAKLVGVDPAEKDGERLYHAVKVGVALVEELLAAAKEIPATLNRFLVTDPGDLTGCTQRGAYHQAIRDIGMSTAVTNLEAAIAKAEGQEVTP